MGDHARRRASQDEESPMVGAPGMELFWTGVAQTAPRSLVDPRVPGRAPDPMAMLAWVDHDHDGTLGPAQMAAKVTAQLTASTAGAKKLTHDVAERHVDTLVSAIEHTDERDGRFRLLNELDRIDEPGLRAIVFGRFRERTKRDLTEVLATSNWYGDHDKAQALALVSPERAAAEKRIAGMSKADRTALDVKAHATATQLANVIGRRGADEADNAQAIHRALAGKTPEDIEALRRAVRKQTHGNESLYEQLERALSGANEDVAVAALKGDPVHAASIALANANDDARRIGEILRDLSSPQRKELQRRFPAAAMAWTGVAHDQRAELAALAHDDLDAANGARVADLLRDPFAGAEGDGLKLDKQSEHNRDARSSQNLLKELEKMTPAGITEARAKWDSKAKERGEKPWMEMIEERFGAGDPLLYLRIKALASGDKLEARALAFRQGTRDGDQATIDAALTDPDLASPDPAVKANAQQRARLVTKRVEELDAIAAQTTAVGMAAVGHTTSPEGRSVDEQLDAHFQRVATPRVTSLATALEHVDDPAAMATAQAESARKLREGTSELRAGGQLSTASQIYRARLDGDEERVAEILEGLPDKAAVAATELDYRAKYRADLVPAIDADAITAKRDFDRLYGEERSTEETAASLRDDPATRIDDVRVEGPRASRSPAVQVRLDRKRRQLGSSDAVANRDEMAEVLFGSAAGSEKRRSWAIDAEADAIDGPAEDFDRLATHTHAMHRMAREEKIAMADELATMIAIAGKLAAIATLNPAAIAAIDAVVGLASIYIKADIMGEAYKGGTEELVGVGITVATDLAMLPIAKISSAIKRAAVTIGITSVSTVAQNDVAGNTAATPLDLLRNLFLSLVVNPLGDWAESIGGNTLGKGFNVGTNFLGNSVANGDASWTTALDSGNGVLAKHPVAHPHAPAHPSRHGDAIVHPHPHDTVVHPHPEAATKHEPYRGDRTAKHPTEAAPTQPARWHPDPVKNAALAQHAKREGHSGVDLHNHFMGAVSVDDFALEMGGGTVPLTSEQMLVKVRDAVRGDPDYAAHYKVDADGTKTFDDTGGGQGQRGGDAFNNVKAIEEAQAQIEEKRRGPRGPDTEAEIKRIADNAVDAALSSSKHTPFDGGYSIRDTLVKTYIDKQDPDKGKTPYSNYIRMTLKALERDGILYSEQSQSVNKLAKGNITAEAVAKELAELNKDRAAKGLPPMDVRFLAMIETKFLGAEGDPMTADAKWQEQLANLRKLMERGDIIGVDIASPETSDMTAGGAQMQHRIRDLALMLQAAGAHAGRKLVLRPHVGEGYIEMPDNAHGHKAGFDADHSREHYEKAEANLWAMIDAVERLSKTIGPDGKPLYNPADPNPEIRLGHATHATPELAAKMKELGIVVEVNLGSNAISGSLQDSATNPQGRSESGHLHHMDDHSLLTLAAEGVPIVLATDGQGMMKTQLAYEHRRAARLLNEFRVDGSSTMPVTREVFAAAKGLVPEQASGPYVLTYGELPKAMKDNLDSAQVRLMSEAADRSNVVAQGDANDTRRAP